MKALIAVFYAALLTACSVIGGSPESQIQTGAQGVTATAALATVLLRNDRITVPQAKGYSAILHTASGHLNAANGTLVACRKKTGSAAGASPDPCAATVMGDIELALSIAGQVKRTLDAK